MQTVHRQWSSGRTVLAATSVVFVCALAACGGGVQDDGNGQVDRLACATACKPSSSLATDQIRPSFVVVSDGNRVQAQAGFSSGSDLRFNVEIDGSDSLRLSTSRGTQGFHIPASSLSTFVVEAFRTLVAGATPYLSEVNPDAGAAPMQFEFVRGATIYTSSVQLPNPYQITNPSNGVTVAITTRTLPVALSSASPATAHGASFSCVDVNGNTATGGSDLSMVAGSLTSASSGVSYTLDIGAAVDRLSFSTTNPRGSVARCDVVLKLTMQNQGQADPRFGSAQVFSQQLRSVTIAMR